jgi:hypothetical protein
LNEWGRKDGHENLENKVALGGALLIQKIGKKTWNQKEEKYHSIRSTQ